MPWAKPKAPKSDRGYDYAYVKLRKALLPKAYGTPCVRCGLPMLPGQKLHLDHDDLGPQHPPRICSPGVQHPRSSQESKSHTDRSEDGEDKGRQTGTPLVNRSRFL
jgi:hypothetical protein